jgi:hypothetical protein
MWGNKNGLSRSAIKNHIFRVAPLLADIKINPGRLNLSCLIDYVFNPASVTVGMAFKLVELAPPFLGFDEEKFPRHPLSPTGLIEQPSPLWALLNPPGPQRLSHAEKASLRIGHHRKIHLAPLQAAINEQEVNRFHRNTMPAGLMPGRKPGVDAAPRKRVC